MLRYNYHINNKSIFLLYFILFIIIQDEGNTCQREVSQVSTVHKDRVELQDETRVMLEADTEAINLYTDIQ